MSTVDLVLDGLDMTNVTSPSRAVQMAREKITSARDPLGFANGIIKSFGGNEVKNADAARLTATALIEEAIRNRENFDYKVVEDRVKARVEKLMETVSTPTVTKTARKPRGSKREVVKQIYLANKDKAQKDIVPLVIEALGVSKYNAYTYIYLVRKDLGENVARKPKAIDYPNMLREAE